MTGAPRRGTRRVPLVTVLAATAMMAAGCKARDAAPTPAAAAAAVAVAVAAGGDFTLTDHNAQRFALQSLRGTVVMIFFGYSTCPDVCPTTLSKLSRVTKRLGPQQGKVKTLYITVDPDRDTPAALKADLALFDLDALGLTGTRQEIDTVVAQYGASYEIVPTPQSAGKYSVSHSTTLYVLDAKGVLRRSFPYEATVDEIVQGLEPLIAEAGAGR
ncbi:MAG: SCO family protein [Gemmatimonadaceae bacterium]|nr:SCO family protein [Gemmatimonadaceae bacterium]